MCITAAERRRREAHESLCTCRRPGEVQMPAHAVAQRQDVWNPSQQYDNRYREQPPPLPAGAQMPGKSPKLAIPIPKLLTRSRDCTYTILPPSIQSFITCQELHRTVLRGKSSIISEVVKSGNLGVKSKCQAKVIISNQQHTKKLSRAGIVSFSASE